MHVIRKLLLISVSLTASLSAQTPSPAPPASSKPQATGAPKLSPAPWQQYAVYWTAEPGWKTELHLRNNLGQSLTVTPALRTAGGTETSLPAITIAPNDVATADLGAVIASVVPQLVSSYGSIVFRYTAPVVRALYAAVMVELPGTPIEFHLDAFPQASKAMTGGREGIWWLPNNSVKDWLVLANTSDTTLPASLKLYDSSGKAWQQTFSLNPRETSRLSIRALLKQGGLSGSFGGISIDASGRAADLDSVHFVYDDATGFLTLMKMFDRNPSAVLSERSLTDKQWTIRAPMLALTNPDPALALPSGTTLKPAIYLRNASANAYTAQLVFNWRFGTTTGKGTTAVPLQPYETVMVDVAALQAQGTIPPSAQWAYVSISAPIKPDDLLAVATSYDATGRLGAQTPFTDQVASHWEGGMWEVDTIHDTIIAVGNAGTRAAKAQITLYYNAGQAKYQVEQNLAQDEQIWLDIGKLIRNQVPDTYGTTMPVTVMSGSYELKILSALRTDGGLFEGKLVVDKTYGYAVHGCAGCCPDYDPPFIIQDPLGLALGDSYSQSVWAVDNCSGNTVQLGGWNWGTGDAQVATANENLISASGVGSTTNFTSVHVLGLDSRGYCRWSAVQPTAPVNVQAPDHMMVLSDATQTIDCGSNPSSQQRLITYEVDDISNTRVQAPFLLKENVPVGIVSSCNQQIVNVGSSCTPNTSYVPNEAGKFADGLFPGCPTSPNVTPCGFQFPNQQWQWCPNGGTPTSIGTTGLVNAQNTAITVNGSLYFVPGTTFPP